MKQKEKLLIKDKILSTLCEEKNHFLHSMELSKRLKVDHLIILGLGQELFLEEFVNKTDTSLMTTDGLEIIFKIRTKGVYFIKEEGGFLYRYQESIRKKIWSIVKIIAAVLNAIMIILISIWATMSSIESKELKKELIRKDSINQKLIIKLNENNKHIQK